MRLSKFATFLSVAFPLLGMALPVSTDENTAEVGNDFILDPCGFKKRDGSARVLEIACPQ